MKTNELHEILDDENRKLTADEDFKRQAIEAWNRRSPMKEQIEEIAKVIEETERKKMDSHCDLPSVEEYATVLYNAGYRKQSKGEWGFDGMSWTCSECGEYATKGIKTTFCPNCGAKMKGESKDA